MTCKPTVCQPQQITRFVSGQLSELESMALENHLNQCETCGEILTATSADLTFWEDTKKFLQAGSSAARCTSYVAASSTDDRETNAVVSDLQEELAHLLDPTDDPHMLGRFGGYEIAGVIGRGGMGMVLKGMDISLDRFVAIKVLHPSGGASTAARQRFAREAQAAAAVVHDNVLAIHGVDQWKGIPFLVMPYVKGESLQQRIDRCAPLSIETTLEITMQIARGLAAAHDQGLVHRDIKPANILMLSSVSRVLITDFGLARAVDDASLTQSGTIAGTPQYMSPEQARGESIDGRTDQFSLGCLIYAMLCGRPPFHGENSYAVLRQVTDQPHVPVDQVQPGTPTWLCRIIDRLLQKDPNERFSSAHQIAQLMEESLAHMRQPATVVLPKLVPVKRKRSKLLFRLSFATLLMLLLGLASWKSISVLNPSDPPSSKQSVDADLHSVPAWDLGESAIDAAEAKTADLFELDENTFWNPPVFGEHE